MKTKVLLFALIVLGINTFAQEDDFYILKHPYDAIQLKHNSNIDEHPDLQQVIKEIKTAIENKNWDELKKNMSNEGGFIEEFSRTFNPEDPDSEVWSQLYKAFRIDGCIDDDYEDKLHYSAPYVFSKYPEEEIVEKYDLQMGDQTNFTTIVGNKVNVRSAPSVNSVVIDQLSYDIVVEVQYLVKKESLDGKYTFRWTKVYTPSGKTGYVYGLYAFNFLSDFTARFHKKGKKWLFYAFYNG